MGIDIELQGSINLPQEINKNKKTIRGMGNPPDGFLPSIDSKCISNFIRNSFSNLEINQWECIEAFDRQGFQ